MRIQSKLGGRFSEVIRSISVDSGVLPLEPASTVSDPYGKPWLSPKAFSISKILFGHPSHSASALHFGTTLKETTE
jgi:hypothetical protein